jgi:hypothetical protein
MAKANDNASVAQSVLDFLALGLTHGAEALKKRYKPSSKINEFVDVSGEILKTLKHKYDEHLSSDSVAMRMHVNHQLKQIQLTQVGRDVMLAMDGRIAIISNITLTQLYANVRNDIIKHEAIYGKKLQLMAASFPAPNHSDLD